MLDLYRTKNSSKLLPAVNFIHGGGWSKDSRKGIAKFAKGMANNKLCGVTIDYHLSGVAPFPARP